MVGRPTTDVEAEDVPEIGSLLDPLLHHLGEGRSSLGVQTRFPGVAEFVNDFDAMLIRPSTNLILLNRDRVLLAILCRMPVTGNGPRQRRSVRIRRVVILRRQTRKEKMYTQNGWIAWRAARDATRVGQLPPSPQQIADGCLEV